jgi:Tfp pilus assembly protein PilN
LNEENTVEPEERDASTPSPVLIVPGHLFFVDRINLPQALESSEIDDFAELSLENLAPFPVEQLYWGYLYSKSAGSILLYASYKERIKAQGYQHIETYLWVLPDFATLFGAAFSDATTLQLEGDESFSRITFAAEDSLPQQIISSPEVQKLEGEHAPLRLKLESTEVNEQGIPTFHFQSLDPSTAHTVAHFEKLSPSEHALWRADIRDAEFKKTERGARKLTARITRATVYAALFAVLLIVLEGVLFLGDLWLDTQRAKIAGQAPEVRRIEDKQSLMNKLDQVAQNELRPIATLDALNQVRPEGIYFTSTVTEGQNRIIIDGIANTINELNAYADALLASGNFVMPEDPRILTRGGQTTFTATLDYIHTNNNEPGIDSPASNPPDTESDEEDENE